MNAELLRGNNMRFTYPAVFLKNELGGFSVFFPDFEETQTDGDDLNDAVDMAAEVLELVIGFYFESGKELPAPTYAAPDIGSIIAVSIDISSDDILVPSK